MGSQDLAYYLERNRRTKQTVLPFLFNQVHVQHSTQSLRLFLLLLLVLLDVDPSTLGRMHKVGDSGILVMVVTVTVMVSVEQFGWWVM